uniref:Uncharacterized protein n=1 Tax=Oryza nivara TaxID=4536 RepID=A0A0E0IH34_ORYNI
MAQVKVAPTALVHNCVEASIWVHVYSTVGRREDHTTCTHVCCSVDHILGSLNSNRGLLLFLSQHSHGEGAPSLPKNQQILLLL